MKLQDLLNSRLGVALGLGLSRTLPPWMGYSFGKWLAGQVAMRQKSAIVQAVRLNQWVVHNQQISEQELKGVVTGTFRSTAYNLYDFYHYHHNPQAIIKLVDFDPSFEACLIRLAKKKTGRSLLFRI